jgi:mRNA interferase MazF
MTNYDFGAVLLLNAFPFSDASGIKKRPALVLADPGDQDVIVARITSSLARDGFDLPVSRWQECGLLLPSVIRLSKIAALDKSLVVKKLGILGSPDRRKVRSILKKLFGF